MSDRARSSTTPETSSSVEPGRRRSRAQILIAGLALLTACGGGDSSDAVDTTVPAAADVTADTEAGASSNPTTSTTTEEGEDPEGVDELSEPEPPTDEGSESPVDDGDDFTVDEIFAQSPTSLIFPYGEPDQAECFARYLLDAVGVERLAEMGVRPGDDVTNIDVLNEFDEEEVVAVSVAAFSSCELAKPFIVWQAVSTTTIDPDVLACTIGNLDDATVDEIVGNVIRDQELFEPGSEAEERIGSQIFDENVACIVEGN